MHTLCLLLEVPADDKEERSDEDPDLFKWLESKGIHKNACKTVTGNNLSNFLIVSVVCK